MKSLNDSAWVAGDGFDYQNFHLTLQLGRTAIAPFCFSSADGEHRHIEKSISGIEEGRLNAK